MTTHNLIDRLNVQAAQRLVANVREGRHRALIGISRYCVVTTDDGRDTREAERALKLVGHLDQRILERAFSGGLVSQNPNDEPAATLLARIKATRAATPPKKRRRRVKA